MEKKLDSPEAFGISGDLNLSAIAFPKIPKNVAVTEEVNDYLRDQLEQMKREHEALQQELSNKEVQIQKTQSQVEELNEKLAEIGEFTSASRHANSKMIGLSKKLREKNSEIAVYQTKCAKLESQLGELKTRENVEEIKKEEKTMNNIDEVKKLQEKISSITNKWSEEKNLNLQLKNDLKRANKWLQQEVGDTFETLSLHNNSNWRGRAQIIYDLQQKNQELKEKLKTYQEAKNNDAVLDPNQAKLDKKIDALNEENSELKREIADLKRKFDVVRTKYKVQETELNVAKAKLTNLGEINENNKQIINKLTAQLSSSSELKTGDLKQKEQVIKNLQNENEALRIELAKEKCVSEKKSKELLEKNDDIQVLNKRIRSSRPPSAHVHKHENVAVKSMGRLEVERLRLLELTEMQNTRLQEERNLHLKTQHVLRVEKQKVAKLEANLALAHLEQNSSRSGYSSRASPPKSVELDVKDRLELAEENIKALTTRLELEAMERKRDVQEFCKILKNN